MALDLGGIEDADEFRERTAAKLSGQDGLPNGEATVAEEKLVGTRRDGGRENHGIDFRYLAVVDGEPVVSWDPDLNEGGTKTERTYRVWDKKNLLDGNWTDTTDMENLGTEGWRFFRVGVEMAE